MNSNTVTHTDGICTVFSSINFQYHSFGSIPSKGHLFDSYPKVKREILSKDEKELLTHFSPDNNSNVLLNLDEVKSYIKAHHDPSFFFAAFDQTGKKLGEDGKWHKKTTEKDVLKFVLTRLKGLLDPTYSNYEFVVRNKNEEVVGYVELFDKKIIGDKIQYERALFINPAHQGSGVGKEAILSLTDFAFRHLGVQQIFTMADPQNIRSVNNIEKNSGAIHIGNEKSMYASLEGGGELRKKYLIFPDEFYRAVEARGNGHMMCQAVRSIKKQVNPTGILESAGPI